MRTKHHLTPALAVAVILAGVGPANATAQNRETEFNEMTLAGDWGFMSQGRLTTAVGSIQFDGFGNCEVAITFTAGTAGTTANDRLVTATSLTCDYQVNADGTGEIEIEFDSISPITNDNDRASIAFVIVDHGREFLFIRTDVPGIGVPQGVGKLQGHPTPSPPRRP